jgi:hypothetical protein
MYDAKFALSVDWEGSSAPAPARLRRLLRLLRPLRRLLRLRLRPLRRLLRLPRPSGLCQ